MRSIKTFCLLIVCLTGFVAQAQRKDFQTRNGLEINFDLPRRFSAFVQYQLRLDQNSSHFRGSYFSGGLARDLVKKRLSAQFAYMYRASYQSDQHQFSLGVTGKVKKGPWGFDNRILFQRSYPYFNKTYEPGNAPNSYLRNRLRAKHRINKEVDAFAAAEVFYRLGAKEIELRRLRYTLGFTCELSKSTDLTLFYLILQQINVSDPQHTYAAGFILSFNLKPAGTKKKDKSEPDYF